MAEQGFGVVRPLPGSGLVAHMGGLLLVCDAAEGASGELLEALRESAASGADGLALARRAAQVLFRTMSGDPVSCAVAGPAGGGMAVLVSGSASAVVSTDDGETRLSGRDSLTWTDRLIPGPVQRVELALPGAGDAHPAVRLDSGVVLGGGLRGEVGDVEEAPAKAKVKPLETSELPATGLHFEPDLLPPPPRPEPRQEEPVQAQPAPQPPSQPMAPYPMGGPSGPQGPYGPPPAAEPYSEPAPPGPPMPGPPMPGPGPMPPPGPPMPPGPPPQGPGPMPFEDVPHAGGPVAPEQHEPPYGPPPEQHEPPYGPPQEQPGEEAADGRPMVFGVDCKNDHFNDPRSPYCVICGIELVQRTLVPYKGPRPQLGVLLLDDGTSLPLDGDYLLGRDPERAPEVAGGTARPAKVTSPDGSVSRRHLRVALDGWDVNLVDLGSVNGTQIQPPGDPNFYDIPPNEPVTIAPGTTVRIGVSRTMRYESHRG